MDHGVLNKAELTLPGFLEDLARGCPQRMDTADRFADQYAASASQWELLELQRYATMSTQFCRGWPFNRDFCIQTSYGYRFRKMCERHVIRRWLRMLE